MEHTTLQEIVHAIDARPFVFENGRYAGLVSGDGGRSIILQHGVTGNSLDMAPLAQLFVRSGYRVYMLDLPGHGSAHYIDFQSFHEIGSWLQGFLKHTQNPVALVGNSFGSAVCYSYAAQYDPEANMQLFLCCPTPEISRPSEWLRMAGLAAPSWLGTRLYNSRLGIYLRVEYLKVKDDESARKWLMESEHYKPSFINPAQVNQMSRLLVKDNPYRRDQLSRTIQDRTTIFYGDKDNVILPSTPAVLEQLFPYATIRIIHGVGHILHFEAYQEIAEYISKRLQKRSLSK